MPRHPCAAEPGVVVGGKYRLRRVIGQGGMGAVFEAEHLRFGTLVAVKILGQAMAEDPDIRARFDLEARALARVRSMHMVGVLDADVLPDGTPYIVMELLEGCTVEDELERCLPDLIAREDAIDYVRQAAFGISAAHAMNVVHRDLKPANIFLCDLPGHPGRRLVKIFDFGIAKLVDPSFVRVTSPSDVFGTPRYMAPEQVWSARDVVPATDQWALGVVLYELLTGRAPFEGDEPSAVIAAIASKPVPPPRTFRPDIPVELEKIVMRALEKDAANRHASLLDFAAALEPYGHAIPVTALVQTSRGSSPSDPRLGDAVADVRPTPSASLPSSPSWESDAPRRASPRLRAAVAAAAITLVLAGVLAVGIVLGRSRPAPAASSGPSPRASEPIALPPATASPRAVATAAETAPPSPSGPSVPSAPSTKPAVASAVAPLPPRTQPAARRAPSKPAPKRDPLAP